MKHLLFIILFVFTAFQFSSAQWVSQQSGTAATFQSTFFLNINTGWVCGVAGLMKKTTNGGATWESQSCGSGNLQDIYFLDSLTGWACGVGTVFKTTNGGENWVLTHTQDQSISTIFFANATSGWCAGHNGIIRASTDGGATWSLQASGVTTILSSLYFINPSTGWVAGINGVVRKTTNGGTNWVEQNTGVTITLSTITFINPSTGWAAGLNGRIIKTTNAGDNWALQATGINIFLTGITFIDENTGWTCGERTILVTTNSGTNWVKQVPRFMGRINHIQFKDKDHGWVAADSGKILATTTGGFEVTAPILTSPVNGTLNTSLAPLLQWGNTANASGYAIQISTDSNFTTTVINDTALLTTSYTPLPSLSMNTKYFWRVSAKHPAGAGFYSDRWSFTTASAPAVPNLVSPANNSPGESVTPALDWDSTGSITTFRAQVSADSLFISANFDTVLSRSQVTVPEGRLFANTKYFWRVMAAGPGGNSNWSTVWNFRTTLTGVSGNESAVPGEFRLYNNYPNPFNPVTKIKFDLPADKRTHSVSLEVFNMLGERVEVLINRELQPGSYEAEFNGNILSSGTYFYRLETQSFKDIKRMVLIK